MIFTYFFLKGRVQHIFRWVWKEEEGTFLVGHNHKEEGEEYRCIFFFESKTLDDQVVQVRQVALL